MAAHTFGEPDKKYTVAFGFYDDYEVKFNGITGDKLEAKAKILTPKVFKTGYLRAVPQKYGFMIDFGSYSKFIFAFDEEIVEPGKKVVFDLDTKEHDFIIE